LLNRRKLAILVTAVEGQLAKLAKTQKNDKNRTNVYTADKLPVTMVGIGRY